MVVVQRNEVSRNRVLYILTVILSGVVLSGVGVTFSQTSEPVQVLLVLLGAIPVVAVVLSLIQLFAHPKRSQVLLLQLDDEMVLTITAVDEGYVLPFLRVLL